MVDGVAEGGGDADCENGGGVEIGFAVGYVVHEANGDGGEVLRGGGVRGGGGVGDCEGGKRILACEFEVWEWRGREMCER